MEIKNQFSKKICPRHPIQRYLLAKKSLVFYLFMSLHRKISELKGKSHEPSKNSSARAPARARSAGAHHYKLYILWMTNQLITSSQDESLKLKWWLMLFIPNLRVQQLMQSDGGVFFFVSFLSAFSGVSAVTPFCCRQAWNAKFAPFLHISTYVRSFK